MITHPLDLTGRHILLTGGAQGIGEATARLLASRGALLTLVDAKRDEGKAVAASISATEGSEDSTIFVQADVREEAQVKAAVEAHIAKWGKLDTMICAAGVLKGAYQTPEELTAETFQFVIDVNIRGVFLCTKFATPHLEASGHGVIVVLASGAGVIGASSSLAYGASKGGANGLGMTMAGHLAERGIRVNTLCPGNIVTEMKLSVEIENAKRKGIPEAEALATARKNYGTPEGVARVIGFMVSHEADYLRGNVFTR